MKERPILFNAPMVRALLDGSKTQTRRMVKGLNHIKHAGAVVTKTDGSPLGAVCWDFGGPLIYCPFGQPGDRLWVRETWAKTHVLNSEWTVYRESDNRTDFGGPWKPSIHMRRKDSRILLEIVSVRVERLQNISEADCWSEGIEACDGLLDDIDIINCAKRMKRSFEDAAPTYAALWESINGTDSWDANPWVWVIDFKRVAT